MSFPGLGSFPSSGFFGITGPALGELAPGLIRAKRMIQDLVADVTVEERHTDRLTITQQPVERTAAITDHAYKEPPTVTINCGWSASSPAAQGDPNYPTTIYNTLQGYQNDVTLLTVYTGKRKYDNMLLAEMEIITNHDSEFALMATLTFQYVILVDTTTVDVPPNNVQKNPESTGSTTDMGTQNATPVTNPDDFVSDQVED